MGRNKPITTGPSDISADVGKANRIRRSILSQITDRSILSQITDRPEERFNWNVTVPVGDFPKTVVICGSRAVSEDELRAALMSPLSENAVEGLSVLHPAGGWRGKTQTNVHLYSK